MTDQLSDHSSTSADKVLCVLVLYKTALEQSESFRTLDTALRTYPDLALRISLLVYDNSPHSQSPAPLASLNVDASYQHNGANEGLTAAYSEGLRRAEVSGCSWLLLLDQDTTFLSELLPTLFSAMEGKATAEVGAILPHLMQGGIFHSPMFVERFRYRHLKKQVVGIQESWITALNSCACLRVAAIQQIGNFPKNYPLDYLDHMLFHRLHEGGWKALVLNITLPHRLSTNNLRLESSHDRYGRVLEAEWRYVRETGWGGGVHIHRLRLLKRAMRTLLTLREPSYALQILLVAIR